MICKNYTVTGEDVNDYMVMENVAYIAYTRRLLYHFLFNYGFSREKLNSLNLGFEEEKNKLICYKNLMFTESFSVHSTYRHMDDKICIESFFYNSKGECCAEVLNEINWFHSNNRKVIPAPIYILKLFKANN